jgi:methionyl-tRNA formyltransferase
MSRLAFLGTPDAAVPTLRALAAAGHDVELVVTRADKRRSRRGEPEPSPVKQAATDLGIRSTAKLDAVTEVGAELGVVVAFGRIIPQAILDDVPMLNVHFSLLPRWRGAAPVERAILAGDPVTGICVMRLEAGLDTGPVLSRLETPIEPEETADELMSRLAVAGAELLVETLSPGVSSLGAGEAQVGEPTYAEKITPEELELEFAASAVSLDRVVRVGRAWTTFRGKRLIVAKSRPVAGDAAGPPGTLDGTKVATSEGYLELLQVQPEGKKVMDAGQWLRGAHIIAEDRLGT